MFCITLDPNHIDYIQKLNYTPVGLGDKPFPKNCISDKTGDNISEKNKFYGEYTFHYWFWKNEIKKINDGDWVGFCAYRRFWSGEGFNKNAKFKDQVLKTVPKSCPDFDEAVKLWIFLKRLGVNQCRFCIGITLDLFRPLVGFGLNLLEFFLHLTIIVQHCNILLY